MIPLGAIDSRVTTAITVAAGIAIFALLLVVTAAGELRGRRKAKVPPAFRPGPSDEELEKRVLERYLGWGAAATIVISLWIPAYWLREPTRLAEKHDRFLEFSVGQGEILFGDGDGGFKCSACHGINGEGTITQFQFNGKSRLYAEPPLKYVYSRYEAAGRNEDEITTLILDAINRGRPNTPMPTWGLQYGGPLNSAQVEDLVLYIQSIQEDFPKASEGASGKDLFAANCAVCHGNKGQGSIGPNLQVALDRLTLDQVHGTITTGRLNINRPSMPAWAALGNDAIDALVRFIQSIQGGK